MGKARTRVLNETSHLLVYTCSHNDLAEQLRSLFDNQLDRVDLSLNSSGKYGVLWQTDIPRLRAGKVGAQVSQAAWCECEWRHDSGAQVSQAVYVGGILVVQCRITCTNLLDHVI